MRSRVAARVHGAIGGRGLAGDALGLRQLQAGKGAQASRLHASSARGHAAREHNTPRSKIASTR
eukprot:5740185-Pyramimonas_sp.AAC.1